MSDGFAIPLHRPLTEPILLGGVPRLFAIILGTISAAIGLGLQLWLVGLMIWVGVYSTAFLLSRKDPYFLVIIFQHMRHKNFLEV